MWLWSLLVLFGGASILHAGDRTRDHTLEGVTEFNAAYRAWDREGFEKASDLFRQACAEAPDSALCFYWLGVAEFHHLLYLRTAPGAATADTEINATMDRALAALTRAIALDERYAETHALLGTIYGMKIDGNVFRAIRFGPRVQKHREKAMLYGSSNPRVRYLLGTCQFHTAKKPGAWREALSSLLEAERLFGEEALRERGLLEPRWGHSSCLTFIGRTYELLEEPREAALYYNKALARHPADYIARERLARVRGS